MSCIHIRLIAVEKLMTRTPSKVRLTSTGARGHRHVCGEANSCCIELAMVRKAVLSALAKLRQQSC